MSRQKMLFLFLMFLFGGCSISTIQKKGNVAPDNFYLKQKFETYKGVIGIEAQLEGRSRIFLFDTGADLSVIQRDSVVGKTAKYSGASKRKMELGKERVAKFKIGDIEFLNTYALNGDLVGLKEQIPNFGGLIGQSIISKANWLIDYQNKELAISDRNLADTTFQEIKTVRQNGNNPYTFLNFNGKDFKVIIDFGSSSVLNLPEDSEFARAVSKSIKLDVGSRERYTLGGLQTITEKVGKIPAIKLGELEFKNVEVNINTSSQARIGIKFFKDYLIYIDNLDKGVYKLKKP